MEDGSTVYVRGLGDAIALILLGLPRTRYGGHLQAQEEVDRAAIPIAAD